MANVYEIIKNDAKLNELLDNVNFRLNELINFVNKTTGINYSLGCHGKYHAMYVVKVTEHILQALCYDEHTIELGKIAGLLHDIGCIYGKFDHARISATMCAEFWVRTGLSIDDWQVIQQAILYHSNGENINSAVGAVLYIADKIDMSKNRLISVKEDLKKGGLINEEELNKWDDNSCEIEDIEINISNSIITFNFLTNSNPSALRNKYLEHPDKIMEKACMYLKCSCRYEINGEK